MDKSVVSVDVVLLSNFGLRFGQGKHHFLFFHAKGTVYLSEPGEIIRSARILDDFMRLGEPTVLPSGHVDLRNRNIDPSDWEEFRRTHFIKPAVRLEDKWVPTNTVGWSQDRINIIVDSEQDRQDEVDSAIYDMVCGLVPSEDADIEWDIEFIGEIRDIAIKYISEYTEFTEEDIYPS